MTLATAFSSRARVPSDCASSGRLGPEGEWPYWHHQMWKYVARISKEPTDRQRTHFLILPSYFFLQFHELILSNAAHASCGAISLPRLAGYLARRSVRLCCLNFLALVKRFKRFGTSLCSPLSAFPTR